MKNIKTYLYTLVLCTLLPTSIAKADNKDTKLEKRLDQITSVVEKLCKAPTEKQSTYYKIVSEGEFNLRVKIIGMLGGNANFTRENWKGIQRVLRKDQATDNNSFRECSTKLTPIFIEKFMIINTEEEKVSEKNSNEKNIAKKNDSKNKIIVNGDKNKLNRHVVTL